MPATETDTITRVLDIRDQPLGERTPDTAEIRKLFSHKKGTKVAFFQSAI